MASVCFYLQMHQPHRLRRYSVFDNDPAYFDDERNAEILQGIADRCYLPTTNRLAELIQSTGGGFRVSISVTGVLLDQLQRHVPAVVKRLKSLAETGRVEFLGETYHHSLAFLYSRPEFREQVDLHADAIERLFGQRPRVFRNTELIYNNDLAHYVEAMDRYAGVLAEGADAVLAGRAPTAVFAPPHAEGLRLLLKHYRLSDDIAFRFSNRAWSEWPLTAEKFADWLTRTGAGDSDALCNLFMDMETFGEHQWAETGIFDFLAALPDQVLEAGGRFLTVSEALATADAQDDPPEELDAPHMVSWADSERDLSAWLGNAMQSNALHELYKLEQPVKAADDPALLEDWRRLSTSDHVYYMCTKYFADGDVHRYFNPYESPYDSYINFMNVLDNLRRRAGVV